MSIIRTGFWREGGNTSQRTFVFLNHPMKAHRPFSWISHAFTNAPSFPTVFRVFQLLAELRKWKNEEKKGEKGGRKWGSELGQRREASRRDSLTIRKIQFTIIFIRLVTVWWFHVNLSVLPENCTSRRQTAIVNEIFGKCFGRTAEIREVSAVTASSLRKTARWSFAGWLWRWYKRRQCGVFRSKISKSYFISVQFLQV